MNDFEIVMNDGSTFAIESDFELENLVQTLQEASWINLINLDLSIQVRNISSVRLIKEDRNNEQTKRSSK